MPVIHLWLHVPLVISVDAYAGVTSTLSAYVTFEVRLITVTGAIAKMF